MRNICCKLAARLQPLIVMHKRRKDIEMKAHFDTTDSSLQLDKSKIENEMSLHSCRPECF